MKNYYILDVIFIIQCDEYPSRVSTEIWGSMGWRHLTKGGVGEIKKGFPEKAATKLSPEGEAGIGQAKRKLEHCAENSICKCPEAKESLIHFFREVKIDQPCCFWLLQAAKRSHAEINLRSQHICILFTFYHLSLHSLT